MIFIIHLQIGLFESYRRLHFNDKALRMQRATEVLNSTSKLTVFTRMTIREYNTLKEKVISANDLTDEDVEVVDMWIIPAITYMRDGLKLQMIGAIFTLRNPGIDIERALTLINNALPRINLPLELLNWGQLEACYKYWWGLQAIACSFDLRAPQGGQDAKFSLLMAHTAIGEILYLQDLPTKATDFETFKQSDLFEKLQNF